MQMDENKLLLLAWTLVVIREVRRSAICDAFWNCSQCFPSTKNEMNLIRRQLLAIKISKLFSVTELPSV